MNKRRAWKRKKDSYQPWNMPHTTCSYFTQHPHPQSANSSLISVTSAPLCSALLVSMYMCSKTTVNVMLLPQQLQCCPLVLSTTEKTTQQTGQNCKQAPKNFSFPSSCVVLWCIAPPSFVTMPIKGQPAELTVYSLEKPPPPLPSILSLSLPIDHDPPNIALCECTQRRAALHH